MKRTHFQLLAFLMLANPLMLTAMELQPDLIAKDKEDADPQNQPKEEAPECGICTMEVEKPIPLGCRHIFCTVCLQQQLQMGLKNFANLHKNLKCPISTCSYQMQSDDILLIAEGDDDYVHRFNFALTQIALEKDSKIKHCPTPGCQAMFEVDGPAKQIIQCSACKQKFCSECKFSHEMQSPCGRSEAESQQERNQLEEQFQQWARAHTKPCPNQACRKLIEKNDGCNHMTCRREGGGCGHEFCWVCLLPWRQANHDYYRCNRGPAPVNWNAVAVPAARAAPQVNWQQNFQDDMVVDVDDAMLAQMGVLNEPGVRVMNYPQDWPNNHYRRHNFTPFIIIGSVIVAAAASFGAYKLYTYFTTKEKPVNDLEKTLDALLKKALECKQAAENGSYVRETFRAYFQRERHAEKFAELDLKNEPDLNKRPLTILIWLVQDFEVALTRGNCDKEYAALVQFRIQVSKKQSAELKPELNNNPVLVQPVKVTISPAKETRAKQVTKNKSKHSRRKVIR